MQEGIEEEGRGPSSHCTCLSLDGFDCTTVCNMSQQWLRLWTEKVVKEPQAQVDWVVNIFCGKQIQLLSV